jgi:hypothetical protein
MLLAGGVFFRYFAIIMNPFPQIALLLSLVMLGSVSTAQDRKGRGNSNAAVADQLFIFQGAYDSLGTVSDIARLAARHDYVVLTHGFYLDGSGWVNGQCLDVNYSKMPELLRQVREYNPETRLFVYVPATADHPDGCWPQPSVQMSGCPDGYCADFKTWTTLWLNLEHEHDGIAIDGIFIDLVHPALIGTAVRDSVFAYVKSKGKLIMANVLSDTLGLKFAASSPFLQPEDYVLIEGYYLLAGYPNVQTEAMNLHLQRMNLHWAALVTETYGTVLTCTSDNMKNAYDKFRQYGGSAFAYQGSDLGTQTGSWVFCPHDAGSTSVHRRGIQTIPQIIVLEQNYPNPFNPTTVVGYEIPVVSGQSPVVSLKVFDLLGREVAVLVNERKAPGGYEVSFDASALASGVYFYRLQAGNFVQTRKLLLLQ